jgi:uncharacterized protein YndB with AHSA1/START domain
VSHDLRYERIVDASPERVFDAFTAPPGQEAFYGTDDPGWVVESECDLRVDGTWAVAFGPSTDELYRHVHVFRVIDRPRRLAFDTTETRLDGSTLTFETEFLFEPQEGRTLMTVIQRGFPTAELRDEHRVGTPRAFGRFDRVVTGEA